MEVLWGKIKEALGSALPITLIVYTLPLLSWFNFTGAEPVTFIMALGVGISSVLGSFLHEDMVDPIIKCLEEKFKILLVPKNIYTVMFLNTPFLI